MAGTNVFTDPTKSVPTSDAQIIRVDMEQQEVGGRKSHLPSEGKNPALSIDHVPNAGSKR